MSLTLRWTQFCPNVPPRHSVSLVNTSTGVFIWAFKQSLLMRLKCLKVTLYNLFLLKKLPKISY